MNPVFGLTVADSVSILQHCNIVSYFNHSCREFIVEASDYFLYTLKNQILMKVFINDEAPVGTTEFPDFRTAEIAACKADQCSNFVIVPGYVPKAD
jgi:hypothetical protein